MTSLEQLKPGAEVAGARLGKEYFRSDASGPPRKWSRAFQAQRSQEFLTLEFFALPDAAGAVTLAHDLLIEQHAGLSDSLLAYRRPGRFEDLVFTRSASFRELSWGQEGWGSVAVKLGQVLSRLHGLGNFHGWIDHTHVVLSSDDQLLLRNYGLAEYVLGLPPETAKFKPPWDGFDADAPATRDVRCAGEVLFRLAVGCGPYDAAQGEGLVAARAELVANAGTAIEGGLFEAAEWKRLERPWRLLIIDSMLGRVEDGSQLLRRLEGLSTSDASEDAPALVAASSPPVSNTTDPVHSHAEPPRPAAEEAEPVKIEIAPAEEVWLVHPGETKRFALKLANQESRGRNVALELPKIDGVELMFAERPESPKSSTCQCYVDAYKQGPKEVWVECSVSDFRLPASSEHRGSCSVLGVKNESPVNPILLRVGERPVVGQPTLEETEPWRWRPSVVARVKVPNDGNIDVKFKAEVTDGSATGGPWWLGGPAFVGTGGKRARTEGEIDYEEGHSWLEIVYWVRPLRCLALLPFAPLAFLFKAPLKAKLTVERETKSRFEQEKQTLDLEVGRDSRGVSAIASALFLFVGLTGLYGYFLPVQGTIHTVVAEAGRSVEVSAQLNRTSSWIPQSWAEFFDSIYGQPDPRISYLDPEKLWKTIGNPGKIRVEEVLSIGKDDQEDSKWVLIRLQANGGDVAEKKQELFLDSCRLKEGAVVYERPHENRRSDCSPRDPLVPNGHYACESELRQDSWIKLKSPQPGCDDKWVRFSDIAKCRRASFLDGESFEKATIARFKDQFRNNGLHPTAPAISNEVEARWAWQSDMIDCLELSATVKHSKKVTVEGFRKQGGTEPQPGLTHIRWFEEPDIGKNVAGGNVELAITGCMAQDNKRLKKPVLPPPRSKPSLSLTASPPFVCGESTVRLSWSYRGVDDVALTEQGGRSIWERTSRCSSLHQPTPAGTFIGVELVPVEPTPLSRRVQRTFRLTANDGELRKQDVTTVLPRQPVGGSAFEGPVSVPHDSIEFIAVRDYGLTALTVGGKYLELRPGQNIVPTKRRRDARRVTAHFENSKLVTRIEPMGRGGAVFMFPADRPGIWRFRRKCSNKGARSRLQLVRARSSRSTSKPSRTKPRVSSSSEHEVIVPVENGTTIRPPSNVMILELWVPGGTPGKTECKVAVTREACR